MAFVLSLISAILAFLIFILGTFKAYLTYRQATYLKFFHYSGILANSFNCVSSIFGSIYFALDNSDDHTQQMIINIAIITTWYIGKIIVFWIIIGYLTTAFRGGALHLNYTLYRTLKIVITIFPLFNLFALKWNNAYNYMFIVYNIIYISFTGCIQYKFNDYIRTLIVRKVLNEEPLNDTTIDAKPCEHEFCDLLRNANMEDDEEDLDDENINMAKHQLISSLNPLLFGLLVKQTTLSSWIISSLLFVTLFMILSINRVIAMDILINMMNIDSLLNIICLLFKFQYFGVYYNRICNNSRFRCEYLCFQSWDTTPAEQAVKEENNMTLKQLRVNSVNSEHKEKEKDKSEVNSLITDSITGIDLIVSGWINELWSSNGFGVNLRLPSRGVVSIIKLYSKQCGWARHYRYKPSAHGVAITFMKNE